MEGEGTTPLVTLQKFVQPVCGILQQKRFQSASEDLILSAFQVMDTEKKGTASMVAPQQPIKVLIDFLFSS